MEPEMEEFDFVLTYLTHEKGETWAVKLRARSYSDALAAFRGKFSRKVVPLTIVRLDNELYYGGGITGRVREFDRDVKVEYHVGSVI